MDLSPVWRRRGNQRWACSWTSMSAGPRGRFNARAAGLVSLLASLNPTSILVLFIALGRRTTACLASCSYISRSLVLPPRILLMTVIFCLTLVVVRWGFIPTTPGSCFCHEHTTNLAIGVSRQPVRDCGTTFHPDCGGRDFSSILSDDLWKHISLATEAPRDSFRLIGAI